jgi:hypothetical protein
MTLYRLKVEDVRKVAGSEKQWVDEAYNASNDWQFDDATFARSATSFDNPDFVDVVIHCYRCVFGLEASDPALQPLEDRLAQKPAIKVPAVTIDGAIDPLKPGGTAQSTPACSSRSTSIASSMPDIICRSRSPRPSPTR